MPERGWNSIHDENRSWQAKLLGSFADAFAIPRYLELFEQFFKDSTPGHFLELGAGNGQVSSEILKRNFDFVLTYTASENFPEGVEWIKKKGLTARFLDAQDINLPDRSFDVVLSFDVMHHVDAPRRMAREMLRVGRGRLFLTESNALSWGRKIMELTSGHRQAGEKSYTPRAYRSFFDHPEFVIKRFEIQPFLFPIRVPPFAVSWVVAFNRWIEKTPFFKWQCSSVYIYVEYEQRSAAAIRHEPKTSEKTSYWQQVYRSGALAERRRSSHARKLKRLGFLDYDLQNRMLDVACGEGEMLDVFAARGFCSLTGVDIVFDEVVIARQKAKPWRYVAGTAVKLPFKAESFDSILCAHSLHHLGSVEHIKTFLNEAFRCLRKGGRLGLIDHFDSIQLRSVMALILSPLGCLTPWTKQFRAQQLEEKEIFDGYLDHWKEVESLLKDGLFRNVEFKENLFFFYWVGEKR